MAMDIWITAIELAPSGTTVEDIRRVWWSTKGPLDRPENKHNIISEIVAMIDAWRFIAFVESPTSRKRVIAKTVHPPGTGSAYLQSEQDADADDILLSLPRK